jgi:TetR/AcrR family transcriptional repressor of nem operon
VQTRGFNGFSYADVSAQVGITTASLHYHFPSKAHLGKALIERYSTRFGAALAGISATQTGALAQLAAYAQLYVDVLAAGRMCLCGMLAAEHETLPAPMQRAVRAFFGASEAWLASVLERGRGSQELAFPGEAREAARLWVATLEGAMLLARSTREPSRLTAAIRRSLGELKIRPRSSARPKRSLPLPSAPRARR